MRMRSRWPLSLNTTKADKQIPPSGISRVCSGRSVEAKRQNLRSVGMPIEPRPALFNLAAGPMSSVRGVLWKPSPTFFLLSQRLRESLRPHSPLDPSVDSKVKLGNKHGARD